MGSGGDREMGRWGDGTRNSFTSQQLAYKLKGGEQGLPVEDDPKVLKESFPAQEKGGMPFSEAHGDGDLNA